MEYFKQLQIGMPCRFNCGKTFNIKQAESQHAVYHCKLNLKKRTRKKYRPKQKACQFCGKLLIQVRRHERQCNTTKNAMSV